MIQSLRIQNFKSWKDTGDIEMAPLTVFFGTNSSGKSSIGQFLLLLKQTVENRDNKVVLNLGGDKESPVNLGSFSELIHRRQKNSKLLFDVGWDIEKDKIEIKPGKKSEKFLPIKFSAEIGYESEVMKLYSFEYVYNNQVLIGTKINSNDLFQIGNINKEIIKRNKGKFQSEIGKFYMFPNTLDSLFEKPDILRNLNYSIRDLLSNIFYLGPIRISPERMYLWPGNAPYDVGFKGEHTVAALMGAEKNKLKIISPKLGINSREFSKVITNWLGSSGYGLGLIEDFKIERIRGKSKESKEVELKLSTYKGSTEVNLTDVGFGISQVLPVIVQCYYAPINSTILLEQPELHLHPKAQTGLADLFLDVIDSQTGKKEDRNIQLLVESHSEHFLTRLQRRIAEDSTSQLKEKVKLYFCSNEKGESKIERLEINEFGDIQNWPKDFFGDTLGETLSRAEAGSKKRKEASRNEKK